jgi:hypothetical protein
MGGKDDKVMTHADYICGVSFAAEIALDAASLAPPRGGYPALGPIVRRCRAGQEVTLWDLDCPFGDMWGEGAFVC